MQTRMLSVITVWCKIAVHCYLGEEGTQIVTLCVFFCIFWLLPFQMLPDMNPDLQKHGL